jgi:hypothetical protein
VFDDILYAAGEDARIVNLSLKYTGKIEAIARDLNPKSSVLYVVAAGNKDGRLGSDKNAYYPALYGGAHQIGRPNLLAVAALDNDGTLAPFSNWSADHVEIGAPGCDVPAMEFDPDLRTWSEKPQNGTSMAAPLVSFAAALVRSERGSGRGIDIKRRLMVSADLDAGLLREIEDGRKLNIVKAVALFDDVVEVNSVVHMGRVTFTQDDVRLEDDHKLRLECDDEKYEVKVRDLLKIVPRFRNRRGEVMTKLYHRGTQDQLLISKECTPPTNVVVSFEDVNRTSAQSYDLIDVTDYVRRELD